MKRLFIVICLLGILCCTVGCSPALPSFSPFETEDAPDTARETESDAPIATIVLDGRRYSYTGKADAISVKDDLLTIKEAGLYRLTGELSEGGISVEVGFGETVRLILDGVSIRSSRRPCLSAVSAAAVILETEKDSVNLFFSESYAVIDGDTHLIFRGKGGLSLSGASHAVRSSGVIGIESGTLRATASEYGFLSEHRMEIFGGKVAVNAAKYAYATEESRDSLGGIYVYGGEITAVSSEAALFARTNILLAGGTGSFEAPVCYRCEKRENGKTVKGSIKKTGGIFPSLPS